MDVDLASLHKLLKDSTRRNIVLHLNEKGPLAYMELMNLLKITNTGRFNYHLKILGNLIDKGEDGKYRLTERGQLASQLLEKFPEKTIEAKPLGIGDALLIGIVGSLSLSAYPGIFFGMFLPLEVFLVAAFLLFIYWLFVPGAVMWWLTVRRTKSHDFYSLLKPPIVPFVLVITFVALLWLVRVSLSPISHNDGLGQPISISFVAPAFVALGFFPFLGVIITESLHRLLKRYQLRD